MSILDHINRGLDLISDPEEKLRFAEYNLIAGRKAKASAAYNLARDYFRAGTRLIGNNSWNSCRRLYYELCMERAQCEYLTGNIIEAEQLFNTLICNAETGIEKADAYVLKMNLYTGAGKYDEAVQIGINALKDLGVKVPIRLGILNNARELLLYKWYMRNKDMGDLLELPEMKDKVQRKIAQIIIALILATSTSHPDLYSFLIIKLGNHTLKYGNMETSSIGYIGYGITEGSVLGNYSKGYELGKVAVEHVEKFGRINSKCIVYFTMGALICHWTQHGKEGIQYLEKAARYAIEAGDVLTAGYSYSVILDNKFIIGTALEELLEDTKKYKDYSRLIRHENLASSAGVYEWIVSTLINRTDSNNSSALLEGFDEARLVESVKDDKASLATYYSLKMQLFYLFGNYTDVLFAAEKVEGFKEAIMGFMIFSEYIFYYSLTILAIYDKLSLREKKRFLRTINKNRRYMKKWSDSCPANFQHKYVMVEAEISRILGRKNKAMELYDEAIESAHKNGYLQNEAIACELAAKLYMAEGRNKIAKVYMNDAFRLYCQWGAKAKVQDLKSRYPELLDEVEVKEEKSKFDSAELLKNILLLSSITEGEAAVSAEFYTIQNEIKNIAEKSKPEELLTNILEAILKITGADRGELIFERDEELFIEVSKENKNDSLKVIKPIPVEKSANLPKQVVRYVVRTHEPVIVNKSNQAGIFSQDPYIAKLKGKSIVCVPLKLKGISVGVLYLENSYKEGAFTQKHIQLLEFLAGQMIYVKALQDFLIRSNSEINDEASLQLVDYLTEREKEVLKLIAEGQSNKEIAESLNMTVNTVKTHIKNIYGKLQVNRRVQAVEKARELKIL
ncbi:MAG: GAF domain-containing protein [Clostridiaceae bacterium]|nr:GAF domain-containing protein [Clostridiaceae bacterium]